ncbi:MAG: 3-oxoacyl-ACP reductase family protein [Candidatus Omnitrophota bacterium]
MAEDYFKGKVALVTGASRGIGRGIAEALSLRGALVAANYYKSEKEMTLLVDSLHSRGCAVEAYRANVADGKEVEAMIDEIVRRHGRIDILINNAGLRRDALLCLMSDEEWEMVMDTNLKSIFYVTKWVLRVMIPQRTGKVINVSSLSAFKGLPGQTNYAASKGGAISFTRAAAHEVSRFGIQVNAVAPGLIGTDLLSDLDKETLVGLSRDIPLGRVGSITDVVNGVLFLASDRADYITGQTLLIDGGLGI